MSINWNMVNKIIQNIIVTGITAVLFTGGTNYFLQKKNRKANILYEKGYELIDQIYSVNYKRTEASFYITMFSNVPDEKIKQIYCDYVNVLSEFEREVKKTSIFLNKKINRKLEEFISYLKEVQEAFDRYMDGEDYLIDFNKKDEELCSQIISLIKNLR